VFTGIIEEAGIVQGINRGVNSTVLTIKGDIIFEDLKLGDSVSVNGVCLTASSLSGNSFSADVMNETLRRSSINSLKVGSRVNLERAMIADGRFGGHIVSGHIDGTGLIDEIRSDGNALVYKIKAPAGIMKYILEKGSAAIDGVSLTVTSVAEEFFEVSIIPHTVKLTILSEKSVGDIVNIENDIIGKYTERLMGFQRTEKSKSNITMEFLTEYGYTGG